MSTPKLTGKVLAVLGTIAPERLGIALPHEHIICRRLSAIYQAAHGSVGIHAGVGVISFELSLLIERIRLLTEQRQKERTSL